MRKRLRKKLRLREFTQLCFTASYRVKSSFSTDSLDSLLDRFILEAIESNDLSCGGGGGRQIGSSSSARAVEGVPRKEICNGYAFGWRAKKKSTQHSSATSRMRGMEAMMMISSGVHMLSTPHNNGLEPARSSPTDWGQCSTDPITIVNVE